MGSDLPGLIVTVDAKPAPVALDISKTAVLVVDMQNDFAGPTGMFAQAGIDVSLIQRTIEPTARVLEHTRQLSMQTICKWDFSPICRMRVQLIPQTG